MSDKEPPVPPEKESSSHPSGKETPPGYSGPEYDGRPKPVHGALPGAGIGSPPPGAFGSGTPPGGYTGVSGAYVPPPPRPQRRPVELRDAGAIRPRSAIAVVVLSVLTCGLYFLFWIYVTTSELRDALGDPEIKPGQDLALSICTCSLWSIYTMYRNAQKVHAALLSRDPYVKDQSDMIVLLSIASAFFMGVTGLIAMHILQEELNKLARL